MKVVIHGGAVASARMRFLLSGLASLLVIPCSGVAVPAGEAGRYEALLARQPFMPKAGSAPAVKSAAAGSYRFTGFVILGDKVRAGVENVAQNKSYLLGPGDSQDDLTLKEVDVKQKRVVLSAAGETFRLELAEPSAAAPAVAQPAVAPAGAVPPPPAPNTAEAPRRRIIVPVRR